MEMLQAFTLENHPNFDALSFGVSSKDHEFHQYLNLAAQSRIPVLIEVTDSLQEKSPAEEEMSDIVAIEDS
jgi:hypothetical protein